ncbi:MAG: SurA N-terminal domain-containing protein [Treponema sp.]|nr:SurA N-terminal domain-containing protein [Treponema sp.]
MAQETNVKTAKDRTKIGAVIILVISAIVFIPFGGYEVISALFGKRDVPVFGSYNGKKITYERGSLFTNVTENLAERYKAYGINVDSTSSYYLFTEAFSETVKNLAYIDEVTKAGYSVPDEAVNRMLVNYFLDESGNYSPKLYNTADKATKKSLRESVTKSLQYNRYRDDLLGSSSLSMQDSPLYGVKASSKEASFFSDMGKEKKSFKYVAFNTEDFPGEEAVKWANRDNNKEKFIKYDLSAVSMESESDAKALLKQLKSNEITFEDAVSEKSEKYYTDDDGKVSRAYRYQMEISIPDPANLEKVLGLDSGAMSDVIPTSRGFTIFRKDGMDAAANFSDDETVDVVIGYIKTNEHGYIEDYYIDIAKDFTTQASMASFEDAAENFNVEVKETEPFPLNYGSISLFDSVPSENKELANLNTNEDVLQKIFSLKNGETSVPAVLSSNVIVFHCTGITQDSSTSDAKDFANKMENINYSCAEQTLMTSSKVQNNVWNAYFENFTEYGRNSK